MIGEDGHMICKLTVVFTNACQLVTPRTLRRPRCNSLFGCVVTGCATFATVLSLKLASCRQPALCSSAVFLMILRLRSESTGPCAISRCDTYVPSQRLVLGRLDQLERAPAPPPPRVTLVLVSLGSKSAVAI